LAAPIAFALKDRRSELDKILDGDKMGCMPEEVGNMLI
jgi:hypothetical protein